MRIYAWIDCMKSTLVLITIILSLWSEFQFDVIPTSVVAFTGERAEYHCVAPCAGVFWLINGLIAGADNNIVVTTQTNPRSDRAPGEESTLKITASVYANNSAIKCCVENRDIGFETHSSPAYLTVQGIYIALPACMVSIGERINVPALLRLLHVDQCINWSGAYKYSIVHEVSWITPSLLA